MCSLNISEIPKLPDDPRLAPTARRLSAPEVILNDKHSRWLRQPRRLQNGPHDPGVREPRAVDQNQVQRAPRHGVEEAPAVTGSDAAAEVGVECAVEVFAWVGRGVGSFDLLHDVLVDYTLVQNHLVHNLHAPTVRITASGSPRLPCPFSGA